MSEAYEKIIERVNSTKTNNTQVLTLTVKLLKTHLTQHVPSKETLAKLDQFCLSVKSESSVIAKVSFSSPPLSKTTYPKGRKL